VSKSFVVVGAGLGGLATALRLAHLGHRVTLLEKTSQVGGRNRHVSVGACDFDGGPTLLMMLDPFRRLFKDVGERLEDHLDLTLCDPSYRVFYSDGTRIEGTPNAARMMSQIEEMSGLADAMAFPRMLGDLAALYEASIPNFVDKNFYGPGDFFGGRALGLVRKHRMLGNLAAGMARYFKDPKLQMLFSFQAMYLGLSPYQAPWVYATLTYMEYGEGIWYPKGGMVEVCRAVARLAEARGAQIRLNSPVKKIAWNRVELESGEILVADAIICNADLPYAERELQPERRHRRDRRKYSCSALMIYMDYEGELPGLLHHNVFFGKDFAGNLSDIFTNHQLPEDPAFYTCISSRSDESKAPPGHENLYVLVPCPNLDRPWTEASTSDLQAKVLARLRKEVGFDQAKVKASKFYTPLDWQGDLNLERGAAFGLSHEFWQSAYFRPSNRSKTNPSLYYVGASTVPGNGLPMVVISARLVEDRLRHDGLI